MRWYDFYNAICGAYYARKAIEFPPLLIIINTKTPEISNANVLAYVLSQLPLVRTCEVYESVSEFVSVPKFTISVTNRRLTLLQREEYMSRKV